MRLLKIVLILIFFKNVLGGDNNVSPSAAHVAQTNAHEAHTESPLFEMGIRCYILKASSKLKKGALEEHELTSESVKKINLRKSKVTIIFFHGYEDGHNSAQVKKIARAYSQVSNDYAFWIVSWHFFNDYEATAIKMADNARAFAKSVNKMIHSGAIGGPFSFVGLGMGAHVAGVAAQLVEGEVLRVVGLNPAGPGFYDAAETGRISKLSARFVEVVHTDDSHGIFLKKQIGHADFYVNGGSNQPHCRGSRSTYCNHLKAADYYAEAILKPRLFLAVKCGSWNDFKINKCSKSKFPIGTLPNYADYVPHGKYFLRTNKKGPPYGLGDAGTKMEPRKKFYEEAWATVKAVFGN